MACSKRSLIIYEMAERRKGEWVQWVEREEKETEGEGVEKERSTYWAATTFLTPSNPATNSMLVVCQRNDLTS